LLECSIPVQSLVAQPFNLPWGAQIYAKIIAINVYGVSQASPIGDGATIITYPDAPLTFVEDYSLRTATSLSLTWLEGAANGGSPVIDYQVTYDEASDGVTFVVLGSGLLSTDYTA
jgi:hypothetical protein